MDTPNSSKGIVKNELLENVKREILETERNYVKDLQMVKEKFLDVIQRDSILSKQETSMLFSNIETLRGLNEDLLLKLEKDPDRIGSIFEEFADLLKVYAVYCSNQPRIIETMKLFTKQYPPFAKLVKENFGKETRFLGLEDFLIMPMQRLTKYPLLLESLKKALPDGKEKTLLEQVHSKITDIVLQINERTRKVETVQVLLSVQDKIMHGEELELVTEDRQLIYEGKLKVKRQTFSLIKNVSIDDSYSFLFNDRLISCTKDEDLPKYHVKSTINFDDIFKMDIEKKLDDKNNSILLAIYGKGNDNKAVEKKYKLKTSTEKDCDTWINKLTYVQELIQQKSHVPDIIEEDTESEDSAISSQSQPHIRFRRNSTVEHLKNEKSSSDSDFKETNKKKKSREKQEEMLKKSTSLKNVHSNTNTRRKKRLSSKLQLPQSLAGTDADVNTVINDLFLLSSAFIEVVISFDELKTSLTPQQTTTFKSILSKKKSIKKGIKLIVDNKKDLDKETKVILNEMNKFLNNYESIPQFE